MMALNLSKRISSVPTSATLALNTKAKQMQADGVDVINLTAGEPDFPTAPHVIDAVCDALRKGETKYTPVAGIAALRERVAQWSGERYRHHIQPKQVVITSGAKQALFNLFQAIIDPGDEVLLPTPYWLSYPTMVQIAGGVSRFIPLSSASGTFRLDPAAIEAAISKRTKAIILNSPNNPSGGVYDRSDFDRVVKTLTNKGIVVITDDIYHAITFRDRQWCSPFAATDVDPNFVVAINGVSKAYSMTGFRLGWALGPKELIGAMARLQSQSTSNAATASQWAALAALDGPQDSVETMRLAYQERAQQVHQSLSALDGISCPEIGGTFYAFPRFERGEDSVSLANRLLEEAKVAVIPGAPFGHDDHFRLSFAVDQKLLTAGLERIANFLTSS